MIADLVDAVLLDIGGTLVAESTPTTPVNALVPTLLTDVAPDLATLSLTVRLGAATNTAVMSETDVRRLLALVDIDHFLEVVVTSCDVGVPKPDPTVLLVAMDRLGIVDPSRILYVGDRSIDREAAVAAGVGFAPIGEGGLLASVQRWEVAEAARRSHE